jgi:hypothetical protein
VSDKPPAPDPPDERAGLCAGCRHVQVITTDRGSRFYLCRVSLVDPRFPRYPRIPVIACAGYEPAESGSQPAGTPPASTGH